MSKHKRNRHKSKGHGVNLISGKGKIDHKVETESPGAKVQREAKVKAGEQRAKDDKAMRKAGLTLTTDSKTGQVKAQDSKGNPVLTPDDKAKVEAVKEAQVKVRELRLKSQEAQREAKRAMDELTVNGSGAIKVIVQELEGKIKEAEAKVTAIDSEIDTLKTKRAEALEPLNALLTEYKGLTGLDKRVQASKSKGKSKGKGKPNGNGRFTSVVKPNADAIKVLVTHLETKSLFETSLHPSNGKIKETDWFALRHRFVAHFEAIDTIGKVDRQAIESKDTERAKEAMRAYNLILRAYLSNLKGKVEAIKPIA